VGLTVLVKLRKAWKWASTPRKATKLDVVVVSVALATAYYFAVARPARQRADVAQHTQAVDKLKTETATRQVDLDKCLTAAQLEADRQWNAACKADGQGRKCALSRRRTEELGQQAGRGRNACLMKHSLTN
jgi:hypothetical protein